MPYYVYLLLCDNGSYYAGYTNDIASRFARHRKGQGARYTRMHRPRELVYVEMCETRRAAMARERHIKTLTHDRKRDLASSIRSRRKRSSFGKHTPLSVGPSPHLTEKKRVHPGNHAT